MDEKASEDSYIVVYYSYEDNKLNSKTFSNNPEAAQFLEELAEIDYEFDPHTHAIVIKTEKDKYSTLTVETQKVLRVRVGGY